MTVLPAVPEDGRILAVRLSALGDIVFALPALRALREARPRAHLAWLVEDRHRALLEGHPAIDELLVFPRSELRGGLAVGRVWKHLRMLRRSGHWDLVVDFQSNLKSAMQLACLRAGCKTGFGPSVAREGAQRFTRVHADPPPRAHRSARDLALVAASGLLPDADGGPDALTAAAAARIAQPDAWPLPDEAVAAHADDATPFVLLHTTTTAYGQDKEWPAERWVELARTLHAAGHRPLALWTPADRGKVEVLEAASGGAMRLAPETPTLAHLMALTDRCALLVGTDSGPVHLAARRGTAVVALFGPTDPQVYAPPGPRVRVVYPGAAGEEPPPRDRSRRSPWMERIPAAAVADTACAELDD